MQTLDRPPQEHIDTALAAKEGLVANGSAIPQSPFDHPLSSHYDDNNVNNNNDTGTEPAAVSLDDPLSQSITTAVNLNDDVGDSRGDIGDRGQGFRTTAVAAHAGTGMSHEPPPHPENTLAAYMAKHPDHTVKQAMRRLYPKPNPLKRLIHRFEVKHSVIDGMTDKEWAFWEAKGPEIRRKAGWKLPGEEGPGVEVSELFWKMYLSLLPTLVRDPLAGMTTPDLLGSTTTMPLSIISLIPDIIKHFYNVIVRAQKEVFIATNYWQPSDSVTMVSKGLRDLSARVMKEGRPKVVVKVMYDRGSWEQLWNAHAPVPPKGWTPLDLPGKDEIPGLDMEVINFHKVLLGTFHAKFIIVDRKVVLLSSNNIQDRPNLEMMTHLEGPIVDSFYDVALHSWFNKLSPPLPCLDKPYDPPRDESGNIRYLFRDHNPFFRDIEILKAARAARKLLRMQTKDADDERARHLEMSAHPTRDRIDGLVEAVRQAMNQQRMSVAQNVAHAQEEIALRSAKTMKELRGFTERMGFTTSRPNSRPNSRRGSMSDMSHLRGDYDEETAAMTAHNARTFTVTGDHPASPTLHEVPVPVRSKTMPVPTQAHPHFENESEYGGTATATSSQRQSFHSARDDIEDLTDHGHRNDTSGGAILGGPVASSPRASMDKSAVTPSEHAESPFDHPSEKIRKPIPAAIRGAQQNDDHPLDGTQTPRSFRWHDDLDSPYVPKVSIDEEIPPGRGTKRMFKLSKRFNAGALSDAWATVEDSDELDNFNPHVIHAPHDPFPVAMTCRRPHGMPGHQDIRNPQNAAWLAGCRYAKKQVFIQTPTLNARPIVRAIKQSCRRGVEVILLLDLGFNDKGESIPFQGGTNEQVVDRLYKKLGKEGKAKHLKVYWYTGKDQIRPLNAVKKQRNCHIKLAIFDDESWFHSQEINVMIDSKQVVEELRRTLLTNQNTMQYGGVDEDGVWRDEEGHTLEHYGATGGGGFLSGLDAFLTFAKTAAK